MLQTITFFNFDKVVSVASEFKKSDLFYKDYSDVAVPGDNPQKTKEDSNRFSRHESYEVVTMLNSFTLTGNKSEADIKRARLIIEWMIHDHLPSTTQGRDKVKEWITSTYPSLQKKFPR